MRILSLESIMSEIDYLLFSESIEDALEDISSLLEIHQLTEAEYDKVTEHLKISILDVDRFVAVNDCKCITNPRAFDTNGIPSEDGVLSNTIFGTTMEERAGTFAYIDLHGKFLNPLMYKTWFTIDSKVKNIVHGIKRYRIDSKGLFIEDDVNGDTGIDFLYKNMDKIKFKKSDSISKDISYRFLELNKDIMFMDKMLVIPPFYRDKNTSTGRSRSVGLGGINKQYTNLIVKCNALTVSQDLGFDTSDTMKAEVQEIILTIYDFLSGNRNKNIEVSMGGGMSGKLGIMRRAVLSKTANFSSRVVISAPELKVEKPEDMEVDFDKSSVPLYTLMADFRDFIIFQIRKFFEAEFMGRQSYPVVDKNGKPTTIIPQSYEIVFSDERIRREMERFIHGYNNRFVPVEVPVEGNDEVFYMKFNNMKTESGEPIDRRITWCDLFFIAAVEATKDKHVLITRFPIDAFSNQITTGITVASTTKTEPVIIDNYLYSRYPYIREDMIGMDTSNTFVDTLRFSNSYLDGMGGDYDGDQTTCKGVYTNEANEELEAFMTSKENYVTFGSSPLRTPGSDSIQSLFALTRVLSTTNITDSSKIEYA